MSKKPGHTALSHTMQRVDIPSRHNAKTGVPPGINACPPQYRNLTDPWGSHQQRLLHDSSRDRRGRFAEAVRWLDEWSAHERSGTREEPGRRNTLKSGEMVSLSWSAKHRPKDQGGVSRHSPSAASRHDEIPPTTRDPSTSSCVRSRDAPKMALRLFRASTPNVICI